MFTPSYMLSQKEEGPTISVTHSSCSARKAGVTVAGVLSKIQPAERREGVKKSLGARSLRLSRLRPPRGRCRASLRFRPGA